MSDNPTERYQRYKIQDEIELEQNFLKGTKDPELGVYCDLFSAKTCIEGQDGGVVSALLAKGFDEGLFDAAIVVRCGQGYSAEAFVATSADEVYLAKGTKYLRVNVSLKLKDLINQGKKQIAIVATPCEVKNIRKIQQTLKANAEITVIGLFCFEAFNQAKLKKETAARLGVDLDRAERTQVRHGKFTATLDGKEYSCKVKDLNCAVERACLFCDDFTGRFSDISVGSVGSKSGYSTVVVRSKVGEELLKHLVMTKETANKSEVSKLSKSKKTRAELSFESLSNPKL